MLYKNLKVRVIIIQFMKEDYIERDGSFNFHTHTKTCISREETDYAAATKSNCD